MNNQLIIRNTKQSKTNQFQKNSLERVLNKALIIIFIMFLLFYYINNQCKDQLIANLQKTNLIHELDKTIFKMNEQTFEIQKQILTLTNQQKSLLEVKKVRHKNLLSLQKLFMRLFEKRNTKQRYKIFSETMSTILSANYFERIETISQTKFLSLCYKSSRDELNVNIFHKKCDGLKPTITVIYSKNDFIVSGFTHASWDGNELKQDPNAVLISPSKVYPVLKNKPAINASPNLFPTFGKDDIFVSTTSCYIRGNLNAYDDQRKHDLYYQYNNESKDYFEIQELEVFQMKQTINELI